MNDGKIVALSVKYYSNAGCTPDESIAVCSIIFIKLGSHNS